MNTDRIKFLKDKIIHESAGGVLFYSLNNTLKVGLTKLVDGIWVIPKGHIKKGETARQAALREIQEELGIPKNKKLTFIGKIGTDNYEFKIPNEKRTQYKKVHLFLFATDKKIVLKPLAEEKFIEARWFPFSRASKIISFSNFINEKSRYFKMNNTIRKKLVSKEILLEAKRLFKNFKNKRVGKSNLY